VTTGSTVLNITMLYRLDKLRKQYFCVPTLEGDKIGIIVDDNSDNRQTSRPPKFWHHVGVTLLICSGNKCSR